MDECENLVINLESYEGLEKQQQINDNDSEIAAITGLLKDTEEEQEEEYQDDDDDDYDEEEAEVEGEGEEYEEDFATMGQTESKKGAKKCSANTIETKGTAMSFGFRKKLNSTPKKLKKFLEHDLKHKKQDKCNNPIEDAQTDDTKDLIGTVINTEMLKDSNGNAEIIPKIHFEKVGAAAIATSANTSTATTTTAATKTENPQLKPAIKNTNGNQGVSNYDNLPGANNRFGYRGHNMPRPASTGISTTSARQQNDVCESMNTSSDGYAEAPLKGALVSNLKRRSKSAHTGRTMPSNENDKEDDGNGVPPKINSTQTKTLTFNLNQNTTIEYQRRQFFEQITTATPATATSTTFSHGTYGRSEHPPIAIHSGMHTNVIVRPTPRAAPASFSKFTLQTVSLPKPEFPVAISLSATTPTTPNSTFSPPSVSSSSSGRTHVSHSRFQNNPLTAVASQTHHHFDSKNAKQMANNSTRRGFSGSREISADSGIASMDMALESSSASSSGRSSSRRQASPKRSRSRPRHLQMVMNGRHKFEVRDVDDPLSSESNSFVETLALPKLPADNQTIPLPLCGLVRSNTVLSRETYERQNANNEKPTVDLGLGKNKELERANSEESESIEEEKLFLDCSTTEKNTKQKKQFRDINTCSSKTSSPGSSIMSSWCNAGESLAAKDCSSLSISSSDDSNKQQKKNDEKDPLADDMTFELNDDDISLIQTDMQISTLSSITEAQNAPQMLNEPFTFQDNKLQEEIEKQTLALEMNSDLDDVDYESKNDRPKSLYNALNEAKFAEIALAGSEFLLEDETSPTDSLVSSTDSEEAGCKLKKHKINEELQEKDIDEISPELEPGSPISPGTPTHASRSLSLSECGNLIDDEIADQPALLFNDESHKDAKTDTPTLMEAISLHSLKSNSKARTALQQAIELSLRTPMSVRKAVMDRAESLDTLSPCESICSDDLMMDFETHSSIDSIDRSVSIKSRSGSDLNNLDNTSLFSDLEREGSDVMKELNSLLKVRLDRKAEKESVIAHLPARATRLLNRSRLQQCSINNGDSDSSRSAQSTTRQRNTTGGSRNSPASTSANASPHLLNQQQRFSHHQRLQQREVHSSSDDLMLYDKSFRNAMIQDVLQFKKQLLRLRRILQETETVNPFENENGQLFASCGLDGKQLEDLDLASLTSSLVDDPMQELLDLRRQVVYLQGQVDDRDRTIRLQRNLIEKLEAEKISLPLKDGEAPKECVNMATQTERTRPLAIGVEGLSRSKPEFTSYTTHFPAILSNDSTTIIRHQQQYPGNAANNVRRHTVISATLTNYNNHLTANGNGSAAGSGIGESSLTNGNAQRRASIAWDTQTNHQKSQQQLEQQEQQKSLVNGSLASLAPTKVIPTYKPVRITLIGEPLKSLSSNPCNGFNEKPLTKALTSNGNDVQANSKSQATTSKKIPVPNGKQTNDLLKSSTDTLKSIANATSRKLVSPQKTSSMNGSKAANPPSPMNGNSSAGSLNGNANNCKAQNGYAKVRLNSQSSHQQNLLAEFDLLAQNGSEKPKLQQALKQIAPVNGTEATNCLPKNSSQNQNQNQNYHQTLSKQQQIRHQNHHPAFDKNFLNFKNDKLNAATVTIV